MFFRLWTRAPWTAIVVRGPAGFGRRDAGRLEGIGRLREIDEGQLLDLNAAALGQVHRHRGLADQALVGEVLAGGDDAVHVEGLLEIVLELAAAARLRDVAQVIDD